MQLTVETGLAQSRIQAGAEIEAARVAALAAIGMRAQEQLTLLVNQERQLAETVPDAEAGLGYLRDITLASMASVLMDAGRRMERS